jgi:ankyrin repeat protein
LCAQVVEVLLEHKADVEARNKNLETPLLVVARRGNLSMLKYLEERGANTGALDR